MNGVCHGTLPNDKHTRIRMDKGRRDGAGLHVATGLDLALRPYAVTSGRGGTIPADDQMDRKGFQP